MVDVIFADVAQPDQARIVAINAHHFLKNSGYVVISIKVTKSSNSHFPAGAVQPANMSWRHWLIRADISTCELKCSNYNLIKSKTTTLVPFVLDT